VGLGLGSVAVLGTVPPPPPLVSAKMPRLLDTGYLESSNSKFRYLRPKKVAKMIMKSRRISIRRYEHLPIRIRPWFLVFTFLVMFALAFLGFTNFSHSLPLNDKLLHFLCLGLATGVLYWVFDVEEDARRMWFWRHSALIFTSIICLFFGGIVSEIVQSLLPYKEFQLGDILANLSGSTIGLIVSYHLERRYRHRREIARLYQPIQATTDSSDSEDDTLLPLHRSPTEPRNKSARRNLGNVWDTTDPQEIFAIADDDEDLPSPKTGSSQKPKPSTPKGPEIIVTAPSAGLGEFNR